MFDGSSYPVILGGSGYFTNRKSAQCLYSASLKLPFFHLEDVFLTGFAAENCAIPRYHTDGFHPNAVHFADLKETDVLWHYLSSKSLEMMHKIFMFDDLLSKYQRLESEISESEQKCD